MCTRVPRRRTWCLWLLASWLNHLLLLSVDPVTALVLLSRGKPVKESSSYLGLSNPSVAVDGLYTQNLIIDNQHFACTHTDWEIRPWWFVDLLAAYHISHMVIWNRGDCCGDRLSPLKVEGRRAVVFTNGTVSSAWATLCSSLSVVTVDFGVYNLSCNASWSVSAVKLTQTSLQTAILTLCEVEVWGYPASEIMTLDTGQSVAWTLDRDGRHGTLDFVGKICISP